MQHQPLILRLGTSLYEYTVDTTVYSDSSLFFSAIAHDDSGKTLLTIPVPFHVDNHGPVLTLDSPVDGEYVSGMVWMNVTVTELFPDSTDYNVDNKGWSSVLTPWNTTMIKDGKHTVQVRTRDMIGHETLQTINVVVDNNDPVCIIFSGKTQYVWKSSPQLKEWNRSRRSCPSKAFVEIQPPYCKRRREKTTRMPTTVILSFR